MGGPQENRLFIELINKAGPIICFNYDRCIEYYLCHEVAQSYSLKYRDAVEMVDKLEIWHPYGTVGLLPDGLGNGGLDYGGPVSHRCFELAEGIKTFTERKADGRFEEQVRLKLGFARTIVFMGFSYNTDNLELIKPATDKTNVAWILGTGHGLSPSARSIIANDLSEWSKGAGKRAAPKVELVNLKCNEFLTEFRMALSN
jgi:hypothetical protein